MAEVVTKRATYADVEATPEGVIAELIDGELIVQPRPANRHVTTAFALGLELGSPFQKGVGGPGGWIFADEPELHFGADVLVPDLAGWRRERLAGLATGRFFEIAPDWVCEILSESTERRDRTVKMKIYGEAGIQHIWLIDPRKQRLEAFEHDGMAWQAIGTWDAEVNVRIRPFEAISFSLAELWPLDQPPGLNEARQTAFDGGR